MKAKLSLIILAMALYGCCEKATTQIPDGIIKDQRFFIPFSFVEEVSNSYEINLLIPVKAGFDLKQASTQDDVLIGDCTINLEVVASNSEFHKIYYKTFIWKKQDGQPLPKSLYIIYKNLCLIYPDDPDVDCEVDDLRCGEDLGGQSFPDPICEIPLPGGG